VTGVKDFFVSYTGADVAWAEWIAQTLEDAGYQTVIQAWDFRPGQDWLYQMHQATQQAARTIAVLSPAYLGSAFGEAEWRVAFANDPTGDQGLLLPVRVVEVTPPGLLRSRTYVDLVGLDEAAAAARLLAGVGRGRTKPVGRVPFPGTRGQSATVPFPGHRPAIFDAPPRNPNFTGRNDQLKTLRATLANTVTSEVVIQAVHGLGGVGKTQLTIEYAHRYAADYNLVWWIPAEQPVAISSRLGALARRLGLPEQRDLEEQIAVLFEELGRRQRWLLVYDNAEEPHSLDGYRPPAGAGHVLVTSRNPAWGAIATALHVDVLPRAEAAAFLRRRTDMDDQHAQRLAEAFGDLPLALEQAAAYLEATATPPAAYLDLLATRAPQLFALGAQPGSSEQTIASTWTVSLHRLRKEAPDAQDLLRLCAFLAPDELPRSLIEQHPEALPRRLARAVRDRLGLQQALGGLRRYSLAAVTNETISVHRLVQAVIRHELNEYQSREWAQAAVAMLLAGFPSKPEDVVAWPTIARLLAHVLAAADHAERLGVLPDITAQLLSGAGAYLWGRAEYIQGKTLIERSLAIAEAFLGRDHSVTATSLNHLGLMLAEQGDLDGARPRFERALAIRQARLGPYHPDTAASLSNLAVVLRNQGDLDGARTRFERTLAIFEASLGPNHTHTAMARNNVGMVMMNQGDLNGARPHLERALATFEASLGPDHPDTAKARTTLAALLRNQGDLDGARTHLERALATFEASLGPDHPDTADTRSDLDNVVQHLGGDD
jgi:tetratricopeptide (TPR) repeat protein